MPVQVTSPMGELPLWGMEIDPELARAELRQVTQDDGGQKLNQVLDSVGLGVVSEQLKDLKLGELLDTPPPGVDEAVAISKASRRSIFPHFNAGFVCDYVDFVSFV
jgi:arsenite-transporting ATPase